MGCTLQHITHSQIFVREIEKYHNITVILKIGGTTLCHSRRGFTSYNPLSGFWPQYENIKIRQDA